MSDLAIRPATPADAGAVRTLLIAAFGGQAEADLVERLGADGDLAVALVAESRLAGLCGYAGFVRLDLDTGGRVFPAIGLAPLAAAPAVQRRGVGSALVREGLARLAARGEALVFVLGDAAYYERLGFTASAANGFETCYSGPHFLACRLRAVAPCAGRLRYPDAFAAL